MYLIRLYPQVLLVFDFSSKSTIDSWLIGNNIHLYFNEIKRGIDAV